MFAYLLNLCFCSGLLLLLIRVFSLLLQGLCGQTFYGHVHSANHATFSLKGDTVASCDSYGVIKLWDTRTCAPMVSIDSGPHPANRLAFDSAGSVLAIASNDGTIKMYEVASGQVGLMRIIFMKHCNFGDKTGEL